ncbi:hypothetical protein GUJ93_ZPchr0012g19102 [Zizania palustris]|uniref:Uncharacterized protein n=1 Tax=Zizania palustris TaxID=103762 RepID=A0A8J5WUA8_ZIZPA|nr:hypothetical protein GUJ93_ZPchr0012g19102 [Zizania palustris]
MASPMAIPDDYFPLLDPSLDPSQLPSLVVQPDDTIALAVPLPPLPPSPFVDPSPVHGTALIEIIYISDDEEMDVDDAGAAMDPEDVPLGEPKKEDPEEEEDPDEIEFYEDGE